ncbi:hypothetical protein ACIQNU_11430 [Streptomyces sp. NPDC091292]|uniref:hypothetical protein n=1 Tax=Streptomyces sp. NPDC091292 TaxID=3365991 RepID=UPI003806994A
MPDERYEWLDRDAAERLLRGEPLKAVDDHARDRAERLAQTLDALAAVASGAQRPVPAMPSVPAVPGELPGEATALAAFRAARHGRPGMIVDNGVIRDAAGAASGAASGTAGPGDGDDPVLLGRPAPVRWARPVRFGLVAALAGCMLGGVAVAAGTGVLPSPFGGRHDPAPAASVSGPPATPEQPLSSLVPSPSTSADADADSEVTPERPPTPSGPPSAPAGEPVNPGGVSDGDASRSGASWWARTVDACRDYQAGTLDAAGQRKLERVAKGADRVDRFCGKVLDHKSGNGTGNGTKGAGGGRDGEYRGGDGDGGGDEDGDGGVDDQGSGNGDGETSWGEPGEGMVPSFAPTTEPAPESSPEASPSTDT